MGGSTRTKNEALHSRRIFAELPHFRRNVRRIRSRGLRRREGTASRTALFWTTPVTIGEDSLKQLFGGGTRSTMVIINRSVHHEDDLFVI